MTARESFITRIRRNKFNIILLLASFIISSIIGLNFRDANDAKEAVELLVPYYFGAFLYSISAIIIFVFWTIKDKSYLVSIRGFFLSLVVLTVVPFAFTADQRYEESRARQQFLKREYEKYVSDLQTLDNIIKINPKSSAHYLERSRLKRSQGLWNEALKDAEMAISIEKTMDGYWELGWCHEYLGNLEDASRAYQSAYVIDSTAEWPNVRLEVVNRRISEENQSIDDDTK